MVFRIKIEANPMSRLQKTFKNLKEQQRKALIPYIMAGDPTLVDTLTLMHTLVQAGADVIELGAPFSEPVSDGTIIQAAHLRSLQQGVTLTKVLELVSQFRQTNQQTPIVLMGYVNPIEIMGYDRFVQQAKIAGLDGVLTVDLPLEESKEFCRQLNDAEIDPIFLIAPTTSQTRMTEIVKAAKGYIYYISLKGVTGASKLDIAAVKHALAPLRAATDLPIAVGFGIQAPTDAAQIATVADGVIIGSALVDTIHKYAKDSKIMSQKVNDFIAKFK